MGAVRGEGQVPKLPPPPRDPGPAGAATPSAHRCHWCGAPGQHGRCHYCGTDAERPAISPARSTPIYALGHPEPIAWIPRTVADAAAGTDSLTRALVVSHTDPYT